MAKTNEYDRSCRFSGYFGSKSLSVRFTYQSQRKGHAQILPEEQGTDASTFVNSHKQYYLDPDLT